MLWTFSKITYMNRTVRITCPKDADKRYMSMLLHNYINKIDVYHNSEKIFSNINDAEENLPIIKHAEINFVDNQPNIFEFNYYIRFNGVEEYAKIKWSIKPINYLSQSHVQITRYEPVQGSNKVSDDYMITVSTNQHVYHVGKEYHEGASKVINLKDLIDAGGYCRLMVQTKKVFDNTKDITYDQLQFEIL